MRQVSQTHSIDWICPGDSKVTFEKRPIIHLLPFHSLPPPPHLFLPYPAQIPPLLILILLCSPVTTTLVKANSPPTSLPDPQGPNVTTGKHNTFTGLTFTPAPLTPSGSWMLPGDQIPTALSPSLKLPAFPSSHLRLMTWLSISSRQ